MPPPPAAPTSGVLACGRRQPSRQRRRRTRNGRMQQGARGERRRGEPVAVQAIRRHRQREDERHEPGGPMNAPERSGRRGDARESAVHPQRCHCLRDYQDQDDAAEPRLECVRARESERGQRLVARDVDSPVHAQSHRHPCAQQQPDNHRPTPHPNRIPHATIFPQLHAGTYQSLPPGVSPLASSRSTAWLR